ncbi:hypothetical protein CBS101457_003217 [Exobasidium rhododendri]|nr:hypothetical protein CBS101457_003217 [Exobasidium rhododendri]
MRLVYLVLIFAAIAAHHVANGAPVGWKTSWFSKKGSSSRNAIEEPPPQEEVVEAPVPPVARRPRRTIIVALPPEASGPQHNRALAPTLETTIPQGNRPFMSAMRQAQSATNEGRQSEFQQLYDEGFFRRNVFGVYGSSEVPRQFAIRSGEPMMGAPLEAPRRRSRQGTSRRQRRHQGGQGSVELRNPITREEFETNNPAGDYQHFSGERDWLDDYGYP